MAKLSKLHENSSANDAINALNAAKSTVGNAGRIQTGPSGSGHGTGWKILTNGAIVATGSIPQNSHGAKNLKVAVNALIAAVTDHGILD